MNRAPGRANNRSAQSLNQVVWLGLIYSILRRAQRCVSGIAMSATSSWIETLPSAHQSAFGFATLTPRCGRGPVVLELGKKASSAGCQAALLEHDGTHRPADRRPGQRSRYQSGAQ